MNPIQNAWYVAALSTAVTEAPVRRDLLGQPVVVYRGASGQAAVLSDACPHRFAPLHQGKVRGDSIECPYHGLRFDPTGACTVNPHGDGRIPPAAKVRSYPTLERDGVLWAWTGEPAQADPAKVLDLSGHFEHGRLTVVTLDLVIEAHYELVIDNLMDLSHAPFIHATTLADPDSISKLRVDVQQEGGVVRCLHYMPGTRAAPQFSPFRTSDEPLCDGHAHIEWQAPSNLLLDVGITETGRAEAEGMYLRSAHLLTPMDMNRTRYTWLNGRNFALGDEQVSQFMLERGYTAFTTEDGPMIEAAARNMGTADLLSLSPVSLKGDAGGIRVRRMLQQLRESESRPHQAAA